jgi:hypothetical protein
MPAGTKITVSNVRVRGGTWWLSPSSVNSVQFPAEHHPRTESAGTENAGTESSGTEGTESTGTSPVRGDNAAPSDEGHETGSTETESKSQTSKKRIPEEAGKKVEDSHQHKRAKIEQTGEGHWENEDTVVHKAVKSEPGDELQDGQDHVNADITDSSASPSVPGGERILLCASFFSSLL